MTRKSPISFSHDTEPLHPLPTINIDFPVNTSFSKPLPFTQVVQHLPDMFFFSCDDVIGNRIQQTAVRAYHDRRVLLIWITMVIIGSDGRFSAHDFQVFREFLVSRLLFIDFMSMVLNYFLFFVKRSPCPFQDGTSRRAQRAFIWRAYHCH
jgi:hypothetical protein